MQKFTSITPFNIPVMAALLFGIGCILGFWIALGQHEVISGALVSDVHFRYTDFMNYARQRMAGDLQDLHPVYAAMVERNGTLPVVLTEFLIKSTGSEGIARNLMILLYGGLFAIGMPLLVYVFTQKKSWTFLTLLLMYLVSPWNEKIYSYNPEYFITGYAANSLFFIELAFIAAGSIPLTIAVWLFHLALHPTTAVMWSPLLGGLALLLHFDTHRFFKDKKSFVPALYGLIFIAPVAAGVAMLLVERMGLMGTIPYDSFKLIAKTAFYHSVLFGTEQAHLIVGYIGSIMSLVLLTRMHDQFKILQRMNVAVAVFGFGILLFACLFAEDVWSAIAVAMLPLRFAVIMYGLLIVNMVVILSENRPAFVRLMTMATLVTLIAAQISLINQYYNPLLAIWIWPLACVKIIENNKFPKVFLRLVFNLIALLAFVLLFLPSTPSLIGPLSKMENILKGFMDVPPASNLPQIVIILLSALPLLASFIAAAIAAHYKKLTPFAFAALFVVLLVVSANSFKNRFITKGDILGELFAAIKGEPEKSYTSELRDWVFANIPEGAPILGNPTDYYRRILHHRVSIDLDLISLVPYVPSVSDKVIEEYKRDYGVDFNELVKSGNNIHSAFVLDDKRWIEARDQAIVGKLPYDYVIERTGTVKAKAKPVFENEWYRVYRCRKG